MLTLSATRIAATRLLAMRAEASDLSARIDELTDTLRPALERWGGVAIGTGRTVYSTVPSVRRGWDTAALVALARSLGASDADMAECMTTTHVRASVRDRQSKPTDK